MTDQPDGQPSGAAGPPTRVVDAERVRVLAAHARLNLSADREPLLGASLTDLLRDLDHLGELRLGETPPATAFDARWA